MRRIMIAVALVAAATGCGGLTEPQSQARLHGTWREVPEPSVNWGTRQNTLTFGADGSFTSDYRVFGEYPGQAPSDLSGYIITSGTYTPVDGAIHVRPQRMVLWDFYYGADSPETVQEFPSTATAYDDGRFEIIRNVLILYYTSYPADAPVATTRMYRRVE